MNLTENYFFLQWNYIIQSFPFSLRIHPVFPALLHGVFVTLLLSASASFLFALIFLKVDAIFPIEKACGLSVGAFIILTIGFLQFHKNYQINQFYRACQELENWLINLKKNLDIREKRHEKTADEISGLKTEIIMLKTRIDFIERS